ncbi:GNAT family N-acetyltransferase [Cellulomonas soli]|uniref:N-acetyltransferase domain-containing protein n=1 Tax=Cellulomonas soli TaxID=931535 RepID=A0A512P8R3_9CELL|nr:GNAT family N-acetyltransferase [Cellulomonas soli]NYI57741.1 GNAT superfamily N-acetyltransferase [Cellulomonas soli]GEP67522.1 hypothetical protein CSO01_02370 [Cellulomonas soli]
MAITFRALTDHEPGIIVRLLSDAYAFDPRYQELHGASWQDSDDFFFAHPQIADACCFVTADGDEPIGVVMWDPRQLPESVEIGHNGIVATRKGSGYGRLQLLEALARIRSLGARRIVVTTDDGLVPAQRMYESAGFVRARVRRNDDPADFVDEHLDYVLDVAQR